MLPKSSSESMGLSDARVSGVAGRAASTSTASLLGWNVLLAFCCGGACAVEEVIEAFRFLDDVVGDVVAEQRAASPRRSNRRGGERRKKRRKSCG